MVRTGTKTSEEIDGAKEVQTAEATAITVTVAEKEQSQNMHVSPNLHRRSTRASTHNHRNTKVNTQPRQLMEN